MAFSTISATGNVFISSWIMIIYLLIKGEEATGPDLEEKLSNGNYKLALVDGTFFHYFQFSDEYTVKKVIVQNFKDLFLANPFGILALVIEFPLMAI